MTKNPHIKAIADRLLRSSLRAAGNIPESAGCKRCGLPAVRAQDFKDTVSMKEYLISGFCQKCQDEVFK